MKNFEGVGIYLDKAIGPNPQPPDLRGMASGDSLLGQIADLISQAYANPDHAAGMIEAAEERFRGLEIRVEAATAMLKDAHKDLSTKHRHAKAEAEEKAEESKKGGKGERA